MENYDNPDRQTSKNNHLYCISGDFLNFAKKYMESLPLYEELDVEKITNLKKKLLKKIL